MAVVKDRSPNYPSIGLTEAEQLLRKIWEKGKRAPMNRETLAEAAGFKLSGPTASKISALGKYGLLERTKDGHRVSDLGMKILHGQAGDVQEARREAALGVDLISEVAKTHSDTSDSVLKSHLMLQRDFSEDGAAKFADVFRDVFLVAGLGNGSTIDQEGEGWGGDGGQGSEGALQNPRDKTKNRLDRTRNMPGLKEDVYSLDQGAVIVQWPEHIQGATKQDIGEWLKLVASKIKRAVDAPPADPASVVDEDDDDDEE